MPLTGDVKLDDWITKLKKSSAAFDTYFKPLAIEMLQGEFAIVEGVTEDRMAQVLDQSAGIDLWFFNTKQGVRGMASRIQFQEKNWRTFTIRKALESGARTEYEKRKYAIDNEWLYPVLTLQGYLNGANQVLGFAIAKTADIIWMIERGRYTINHTGQQQLGQAEFYVVAWDEMRKRDMEIYIYEG